MSSLKQIVNDYKKLLEQGDNLKLIDLYYDDNIIQIENNEPALLGKNKIKEQEQKNIQGVDWFKQKIKTILVDEQSGVVMGEMLVLFESKKYGTKKLQEAFVQHWLNGKIKYQRFYYKEFTDYNE